MHKFPLFIYIFLLELLQKDFHSLFEINCGPSYINVPNLLITSPAVRLQNICRVHGKYEVTRVCQWVEAENVGTHRFRF